MFVIEKEIRYFFIRATKKEEELKLKKLKLMIVNSHLVWACDDVLVKVKLGRAYEGVEHLVSRR